MVLYGVKDFRDDLWCTNREKELIGKKKLNFKCVQES